MKISIVSLLASLLLSLLLLNACHKSGGDPVDYGPETSIDTINDELNKPLSQTDPLLIQVGQFVDIQNTQNVGGQVFSVTGEVGKTVTARNEDSEQVVFTIITKTASYSGGDSKVISTEGQAVAPKKKSPTGQALAFSGLRLMGAGPAYSVFDAFAATDPSAPVHPADTPSTPDPQTKDPKITYHNLQTKLEPAADPPDAVKAQPNCGQIPGCKISLHHISFDMLIWETTDQPTKIHREFILSPDVPFFARLMNQCNLLLAKTQTAQTLVQLCSPVVNFRWQ